MHFLGSLAWSAVLGGGQAHLLSQPLPPPCRVGAAAGLRACLLIRTGGADCAAFVWGVSAFGQFEPVFFFTQTAPNAPTHQRLADSNLHAGEIPGLAEAAQLTERLSGDLLSQRPAGRRHAARVAMAERVLASRWGRLYYWRLRVGMAWAPRTNS